MVVESISISVIIFLILLIFIREKRLEYAKTAGILLILPGSYLISFFISFAFNRFFDLNRNDIVLIGSIIGLIASCLLIGFIAYKIKKNNLRLLYCLTNGVFILVLGLIMIFDTISRNFIVH